MRQIRVNGYLIQERDYGDHCRVFVNHRPIAFDYVTAIRVLAKTEKVVPIYEREDDEKPIKFEVRK
jgi:hypothetical protein